MIFFSRTNLPESVIKNIPFTSLEYFITSHESRYDQVSFFQLAKALLRLTFSFYGKLRFPDRKKTDYVIYHAAEKTSKELFAFLRNIKGNVITVTDPCFGREDAAVRVSLLRYCSDKLFIATFRQVLQLDGPVVLKFLLVSDLFWNFGYYKYFSKGLPKHSKVISFFSTTTFSLCLNEICKLNDIPFIYYTWGSNHGSAEFRYSKSSITLVKNSYDFKLFTAYGHDNVYLIGDASMPECRVEDVILQNKPKTLILDTCTNKVVSRDKRISVYKVIHELLTNVEASVSIRRHPSTSEREIDDINFLFREDVFVDTSIDPHTQAKEFDLVVNITSTLGTQIVLSGVPVLDFTYYLLPNFNEGLSLFPGLIYTDGLELRAGMKVLDSRKAVAFINDLEIKTFNESLVNRLLDE